MSLNYLLTKFDVQEAFPRSYSIFKVEYDKYTEFKSRVQATLKLTRKEYEKLCEEFEKYRLETSVKLRAYYSEDGGKCVDKVICAEVKKFYKVLMYQSQIPLLSWFD